MKIVILVIMILLSVSSCSKSNLKVTIDTVTKANPKTLVKGVQSIADLLNEGIKNIQIKKDVDKGILIIRFDYPSQKWPLGRNNDNKIWFEPMENFLIRVFDKNGNFLGAKTTGYFFPEKAFELMDKDNSKTPMGMNFTKKSAVNPNIILKPTNNKIEIHIDAMTINYIDSVEFGFNSIEATSVENIWEQK